MVCNFLMLAAGSTEMEEEVDLRELCLGVELECVNALEKQVQFNLELKAT